MAKKVKEPKTVQQLYNEDQAIKRFVLTTKTIKRFFPNAQ